MGTLVSSPRQDARLMTNDHQCLLPHLSSMLAAIRYSLVAQYSSEVAVSVRDRYPCSLMGQMPRGSERPLKTWGEEIWLREPTVSSGNQLYPLGEHL